MISNDAARPCLLAAVLASVRATRRIGGASALWIVARFNPTILGAGENSAWRDLASLVESWIGGSANQTAMLEIYGDSPGRYAESAYGATLTATLMRMVG